MKRAEEEVTDDQFAKIASKLVNYNVKTHLKTSSLSKTKSDFSVKEGDLKKIKDGCIGKEERQQDQGATNNDVNNQQEEAKVEDSSSESENDP